MNVVQGYRTAMQVRKLLRAERKATATFDVPLRRRLWLNRRGFFSQADALYDFEAHDHRDYLSDYARFVRTKRINGNWNYHLDSKLAFHQMMGEFPAHRPRVYGVIQNGRLHEFEGADSIDEADLASDGGVQLEATGASERRATVHAVDWLEERLTAGERLVLKWVTGGGGQNVHVCSYDDDADSFVLDGERIGRTAFATAVTDLEGYMVCEYVDQAEYAAELYPHTANTIRAITMFDERADEAFVPIAVQRIGSSSSEPVDNFSDGGFSAEIDLETGTLGAGATYPSDGSLVWRETHPETGETIAGRDVPGWEEIHDRLVDIATSLSHIPYAGWDIIVTGPGEFKIIEANSYPGMKSLQIHRPLLADERTQRFYRSHGVI